MRKGIARVMPRSFWDRQVQARMLGTLAVAAFALSLPLMIGLLLWMYTVLPMPVQPATVNGTRTYYPRSGGRVVVRSSNANITTFESAPNLWVHSSLLVGVIVLASVSRWLQHAGSGTRVAIQLGGRWVPPDARNDDDRRLLHVVDEMAIAACVPCPSVFVLDSEGGINAFAAGTRWNMRALIVTRGALEYLTRDELQALVAHEMSHLANDDMRLNLWMTAIIGGMVAFDGFARTIARCMGTTLVHPKGGPPWCAKDASESRRSIGLVGSIVMTAVGLALTIFDFYLVRLPRIAGCVGLFMARLLQAAVNRTREELADASAIQFTRHPTAFAGVLKKIGGLEKGGAIDHPLASQLSHLFFASPQFADVLFATHPPLLKRIRTIEPGFDGRFFLPVPVRICRDVLYARGHAALYEASASPLIHEYRLRAQRLIKRARRAKTDYASTGDPRIRAELRQMEAERRDLWIDAGQAISWDQELALGGLSPGVAATRCERRTVWSLVTRACHLIQHPTEMNLTFRGYFFLFFGWIMAGILGLISIFAMLIRLANMSVWL